MRALLPAIIGGAAILVFVGPAAWLQAGYLSTALGAALPDLPFAPRFDDLSSSLHAMPVFAGLAALAYLWLVLIPLLFCAFKLPSRGLAFLVLTLGVNLLCLISAPSSMVDSALEGDTASAITLAAFLFFAVALSFYLVGESPFVSFAYVSWALIALFASLHLSERLAENPLLEDTWMAVARLHAAGLSILLSGLALLESRALALGARGSGILSALLAIIICIAAATMVVYQYRLGLAVLSITDAPQSPDQQSNLLRGSIAGYVLLAGLVMAIIRHAVLTRHGRQTAPA
ncbi:hypothetical protein [Henriciella sp.]|uniref:hypothetical protein n=1 Tax=Henriciella sp. TaxID=1968823 RepID=UPI00182A1D26|nr:hypothetical protein [Henriciella sp.]HIG24022.1 hypothetical protein [Henriciella sp.]